MPIKIKTLGDLAKFISDEQVQVNINCNIRAWVVSIKRGAVTLVVGSGGMLEEAIDQAATRYLFNHAYPVDNHGGSNA